MAKKILIFIIILILLAGGFFYRKEIIGFLSIWFPGLEQLEKSTGEELKEIKRRIFAPPPLIGKQDDPNAYLTHDGTVEKTNLERAKLGLAALKVNQKLDQAAKTKMDDMFNKQYFAHQSPEDKGAGDLADGAGYGYIIIGENLAQGNFENDAALVQAWMDSPGHRENILNKDYQEIGVAVGKGMFEGKSTWMAVQEFGTPQSVCPKPDAVMKSDIKSAQTELDRLEATLKTKRAEIDSTPLKTKQQNKNIVLDYNELVKTYNRQVVSTKSMIENYNYQIKIYNECLGKY